MSCARRRAELGLRAIVAVVAVLALDPGARAQALPEALRASDHSLEHALAQRRSVREFAAVPLQATDLAPSAGALYPLELNVVEAGHAAQNLLLQATALQLGATAVGAFDDAEVKARAALADAAQPLLLILVGRPR